MNIKLAHDVVVLRAQVLRIQAMSALAIAYRADNAVTFVV